jgi:hypothetical protein
MKAAVWRRAVVAHVLPTLPGEWLVTNYALVQAPVVHLARAVVRRPSSFGDSYYLHVVVQPLYVDMETWQANMDFLLGHATGEGYWPGFASPADGSTALAGLARLVRDEAMPYLAAHGTPDGFLALCRAAVARHPSFGKVYPMRQQAATEALLGDLAAAARTLAEIRRIADQTPDAPRWLHDIADEADLFAAAVRTDPATVPDRLSTVEQRMRAQFRLPGG